MCCRRAAAGKTAAPDGYNGYSLVPRYYPPPSSSPITAAAAYGYPHHWPYAHKDNWRSIDSP